ncbi:NF-X1 type zinc finger protein [Diplocarpon rosae]|nr:NF-X1 type zinc finger protein [Diplocarpon rosae]
MSTAAPVPVAAAANRGRRRGPRRGGPRGGGAIGNAVPNAALALRPASVAPETQTLAQSSRGNGRRGGFRGRGRGDQLMVNGQRAFGGQLTAATPSEGSLAGDAPEFVPGQPVAPRARQPQCRNPPRRRMSKSGAPDIATRTHEDITHGQYECVICTNEVLPNSKDLLVSLAFNLREALVQERSLDTSTAGSRERGAAPAAAVALPGMQPSKDRATE